MDAGGYTNKKNECCVAGADTHLGEPTVQVNDICDRLVGLCVHPLQTLEEACQLATMIAEKLHSWTFLVEYRGKVAINSTLCTASV